MSCILTSPEGVQLILAYIWARPAILGAGKGRFLICVEVLRPSQPNGVMSSAVSLPNHTFTGQA